MVGGTGRPWESPYATTPVRIQLAGSLERRGSNHIERSEGLKRARRTQVLSGYPQLLTRGPGPPQDAVVRASGVDGLPFVEKVFNLNLEVGSGGSARVSNGTSR